MIDTLNATSKLVNVFADGWTYSNCTVEDADEAGVVVTQSDGKRYAIPWVKIKNVELLQ